MMKNSGLLRWNNNKNSSTKNNTNNNNNKNNNAKNGNKNWLHPPEALQKGHIAYLVKFLGSTEVDQPKGIEVVKEGIRKLKFNQQLKKAEGSKTPKVELTVSIDGVAIHEPKTKKNLHQYPLHRISYCADDKAEKRFFSFIAKEADSDKHTCFVFVSDKLAEEITLTIGQAFDLAYRRFVETSGREVEMRRQLLLLQKQVEGLRDENSTLKTRITQLATLKNRPDVEEYMRDNNISDLLMLNGESSTDPEPSSTTTTTPGVPPPLPPRSSPSQEPEPSLIDDIFSTPNGTGEDDDFNPRAEELSTPVPVGLANGTTGHHPVDDFDDFDPRAEEKQPSLLNSNSGPPPPTSAPPARPPPELNGFSAPPLVPPPRPARPHEQPTQLNGLSEDIFSAPSDPFGSPAFAPSTTTTNTTPHTPDALAQFIEMKAGFSRGLSFGTADDDFTLESLDPLKN